MSEQTRWSTLIDPATLARHLEDPDWIVCDCRFSLADPDAGERAWLEGHIPGAIHVHLDRDLSSEPRTDQGRHPLPSPEEIEARLGRLGIGNGMQVVAYDDAGGAIAGRLWWMLRYMGHDAVAVLDGGYRAWLEAGGATRSGPETRPPAEFRGRPRREWLVTIDELGQAPRLVDARDPARYRGESEPIDPRPGHIPGAVNHPFAWNLDEWGRFRDPDSLRALFEQSLGGVPPEQAVFYCGSGVSACHDLLAMAHAGLPPGRLYVGSWSEWSRLRPPSPEERALPGEEGGDSGEA